MVGLLLDNALKQVLIHCTVKLVLILIAIEKFNCKCFDWIGYWMGPGQVSGPGQ